MKYYNKLVRDKIPEIMIKNNAVPNTRILSDEEYIKELNIKLKEELNEYLESDSIEELSDLEEVIIAIRNFKNITNDEFEKIRKEKVLKRGAFENKIFLISEE